MIGDAIDVDAIERALQAWVVAGSGLDGAHVAWSDTGRGIPTKPYISLNMIGDSPIGLAELGVEDAANPQQGAEINQTIRQPSQATLSIQCYQTTNDATGRRRALAILKNVALHRYVPAIADALAEAGVGVAQISSARSAGAMINSANWEPRCVMEVQINLIGQIKTPGTYIQSAEIVGPADQTEVVPPQTPAVGTAAGTSTAAGVSG